MSNRRRSNPFRSPSRINFPPLDEFFGSSTATAANDDDVSAVNTSAISLDRSFRSRTTACQDLNFSVDMSIGGKAELAQHRYHVQKYGIDGVQNQNNEVIVCNDNNSIEEDSARNNISLGLHSAGGDDWDRFMDDTNDNISNVSFSAKTDTIKREGGVGYSTPSPDQSSDDDDSSGNCFFENKEAIQSLETPEKFRYTLGDEHERTSWGVTYARGMQDQDGFSGSDDSPNRSTNVSSTSTGSVLDKMFQTVLRFNDDFEELASDEAISNDDQSSGQNDHINDKNISVSFAGDTSFGFIEDFDDSSFTKEEESSLDADRSSDEKNHGADRSSFAADKSIATSGSKHPSSSCFPNNLRAGTTTTRSSPASNAPCLRMDRISRETTSSPSIEPGVKNNFSPTNLSLSGLSPIDSLGGKGELKSPSSAPFDQTPVLDEVAVLPHPDIDYCQSHFYPADECTNRKLFQETNHVIDVIHNKSLDQCCTTQTTVESVESYFETTIITSLSEEVSPFSYSRTFGSNNAFWINSTTTTTTTSGGANNKISKFRPTVNRRGVTLCRSAKLLDLGYRLSQSNEAAPEVYGDCSF